MPIAKRGRETQVCMKQGQIVIEEATQEPRTMRGWGTNDHKLAFYLISLLRYR
jgi:hypothetical protein